MQVGQDVFRFLEFEHNVDDVQESVVELAILQLLLLILFDELQALFVDGLELDFGVRPDEEDLLQQVERPLDHVLLLLLSAVVHSQFDEEVKEYLRTLIHFYLSEVLFLFLECQVAEFLFYFLELPLDVEEGQVTGDLLVEVVAVGTHEDVLHAVDHLGVERLPVLEVHLVVLDEHVPETAQDEVGRQDATLLPEDLVGPVDPIRVLLTLGLLLQVDFDPRQVGMAVVLLLLFQLGQEWDQDVQGLPRQDLLVIVMLGHVLLTLQNRHVDLHRLLLSEPEVVDELAGEDVGHVTDSLLLVLEHVPAEPDQLDLHGALAELLLHVTQHEAAEVQDLHVHPVILARVLLVQVLDDLRELFHHSPVDDLCPLVVFECVQQHRVDDYLRRVHLLLHIDTRLHQLQEVQEYEILLLNGVLLRQVVLVELLEEGEVMREALVVDTEDLVE